MDILNISDDPYIIDVIKGTAGSRKSSELDKKYHLRQDVYRVTSTVKLMKDAIKRFGCRCGTIAGTLFTTEKGHFFVKMKDPDAKVIIIDEILQTSPKVLEWCKVHRGEYKIIITTDTHQMLPKGIGKIFLKKFNEFCELPFVNVINLRKTYRPVNKETEDLYYELYDNVENDKINMFEKCRHLFRTIDFSEMTFSKDSVYLTHTNDIEEYLYRVFDIYHRFELDFIPKGCISRTEGDVEKYPILCQNQAERLHTTNYLQASNVGTVTRYQGSEVLPGNTCYFIIGPHSKVGNREFYTALTRCKDMKDFVIVICKDAEKTKLKTLFGKKVKDMGVIHLDGDDIDAKIYEDHTIDPESFNKILSITVSDDYEYSKDVIYINGEQYHRRIKETEEEPKKYRYTLSSLLKKHPEYDFSMMEDVWKILESRNVTEYKSPHFSNAGTSKGKENYKYYIDLFSAYPHILKYSLTPVNGEIIVDEEKVNGKWDPQPGYLDYYYIFSRHFNEQIGTDVLVKQLLQYDPDASCYYLFSVPAVKGNSLGDFLVEESTKSIESKNDVKNLHWGYLERHYMDIVGSKDVQTGEILGYFVRNSHNRYELLSTAIFSSLLAISIHLAQFEHGHICVDATYFDEEETIEKMKERMAIKYPKMQYRIKEVKTGKVIYQTYEDLKSKDDIRREKKREAERLRREKFKNNN